MSHLGSQLSALVDGQLPPAAAERALEHVARCAECAAELRAARAARAALWAATDVPPAPDLTARLLALGAPGAAAHGGEDALARRSSTRPAPRRATAVGFTGSVPLPGHAPPRLPRGALRGDVVHRQVARPVLVAAAGCVAAFLGGLVALGGEPAVLPETQRSYALALLAAAPAGAASEDAEVLSRRWVAQSRGAAAVEALPAGATASALGPRAVLDDVALSGPDAHEEVLAWMADHGWASPVSVPDTFRVTGLRLDRSGTGSLEVDLVGPSGPVVVVQEHGRLHPDVARGMPVADVGGRQVHVVCNDPWYVVWQSGDSVVTVVADAPTPDVRELVAAHPAAAYDDGVGARLSRGWDTLTGSWVP